MRTPTTLHLETSVPLGEVLPQQAEEIQVVATTLNNRPRKTLGWKTPAEALNEQLLSLQQAGVASTG